jgi:hypothetical protein
VVNCRFYVLVIKRCSYLSKILVLVNAQFRIALYESARLQVIDGDIAVCPPSFIVLLAGKLD